jgi:hypothetical protein
MMPRASLRPRPSWLPELLWILATALVATVVATLDLKLWKMHAHVPIFGASGDGAYYLATVKDVVEHGWFWRNPDLGAPFGQANYDFAAPFGDVVHYVIVKVLALLLGDPVLVFNAFFLLSFPLIAVVAYAVMRDLGAAPVAALVAGVLFAFLPYHVLRNQSHLFLTAYYSIPLAVWLVVSLAEGRTLLGSATRRRTLLVVAACIVVGAASNYYAVFAMVVLVTVVPVAAIARRSPRIAVQGVAVTALVAATFALGHAPAIVYPLVHGANENVAEREASESELFGLKLAYMVIPRPQHRVAFMARRGEQYSRSTPLRSEGFDPSLGTVATLGLIAAIIVLLSTGLGAVAASVRRRRIAAAGAVALTSFVVGTIGGVSTLIAYELTPQVRAWNRLSLVIAFASLLAVALLLTALGDRLRARGGPAWLLAVVAATVGVVGILDQTSPRDAPDYAAVAAAWKVDGDFAATMQDRLAAGTKVLQLPYMSYPENGPVLGVADYDLLKGYLHSTGLRWTYGAVRGRPSDWLAQHQGLPPDQLAACAAAAGFGAVYVDRAGYPDGGAAIIAALEKIAGPGTAGASADGRLQFFDLRPAAARFAQRTPTPQRARVSDALLYPVMVGYGDGFSYQEIAGTTIYRWAGPDARVKLDNPLDGGRTVTYTAQLFGGGPAPSTVTFTLPDGTRKAVRVDDKGRRVRLRLRLEEGDATLRLRTAGPAAPTPPGNTRDLRLRVQEQTIEYAPLAAPLLAGYVAAATP